jgi:hypothetical protein
MRAGLLLSELGGHLLSPDHAPAGTKHLSNLLASSKWSAELLSQQLWSQALRRVQAVIQAGEQALLIWDESEWEKHESLKSEGIVCRALK